MIHSSRRYRKTKAIAEALAMLADAHPELVPHRPRPVRETDEWLWESATEFCAALDHIPPRCLALGSQFIAMAARYEFADPLPDAQVPVLAGFNH